MAITIADLIGRHSASKFMRGVAKSIATTDELANLIPFTTINARSTTYNREGALSTTSFIGDDGVISVVDEADHDAVTVELRRIASSFDIDRFAERSSDGSETARQTAAKLKATWRMIKDRIINGAHTSSHTLGQATDPFAAIDAIGYGPNLDSNRNAVGRIRYTNSSTTWAFQAPGDLTFGAPVVAAADGTYTLRSHNPSKFIIVTLDVSDATADGSTDISFTSSTNEFDGLIRLVAPAQSIAAVGTDGDDFALSMLDDMLLMEKVNENRVFFMHGKLINMFLEVQRNLGGASPTHMRMPAYSGPVLEYRGIPILRSDNCLLNETVGSTTDATSIWLASLSAESGLHMLAQGEQQNIDADPRDSQVLGFDVVNAGVKDNAMQNRWHVGWTGALALKSNLALVRRAGVKSA